MLESQRRRPRRAGHGRRLLGVRTVLHRYWFRHTFAGDPTHADVDFDVMVPADRSAEQVIADYRAAIAESDAHLMSATDLEAPRLVRSCVRTL